MVFFSLRSFGWLMLTLFGIFLDQASKIWAQLTLQGSDTEFGFNLAYNRAIAFSLPVPLWGIYLAAAVVLIGVLIFAIKERWFKDWRLTLGLCLLFAGGLGNLIDRVRLGYVIDFIQIGPWPTFNLADCFVFVGVVILALFQGRSGVDEGAQ